MEIFGQGRGRRAGLKPLGKPYSLWMSVLGGVALGAALIAVVVASVLPSASPVPTFTLRLEIVDADSGEPVRADVLLDGQALAKGVSSLERLVPLVEVRPDPRCLARNGGEASACPGTRRLEVIAPGYAPWALDFRANLPPGRTMGGPVRLKRLVEPESVALVIDGPGRTSYLDALLPLLDGAQTTVDVLLFKISSSGWMATNALIAAAKRGVSVRVLLERGTFASADAANEAARATLEASGVQVRWDDPKVETHAKLVLVDGRDVLLHSGNWNAPAFQENVEIGLQLRSTRLAAQVGDWFQALWEGADPAKLPAPFRTVEVAGWPALALLGSGASRPYRNTVTALVQGAKATIDVLMYEISGAAGADVLVGELEAAARRGVIVRVVLDATAASWGQARTAASARRAAELRRAGATVCFDDPETLMHAKVVVVDGEQVVVGSTNWTGFGLSENVEADVFVRSSALAEELEGQWAGCG